MNQSRSGTSPQESGRPRRSRRRFRHRPARRRGHGRTARQPSAGGDIRTSMIIAAALIEGVTLFAEWFASFSPSRSDPRTPDGACDTRPRFHGGTTDAPRAGLTDINFALSFWTFVTFALLIVVLGSSPGAILQMIETREKTIAEAIEAAKRERAAAEAASAEMRAPGAGTRGVGRARAQEPEGVAAAKAELIAAAKKQSDELLAAARKTISEEKRQASPSCARKPSTSPSKPPAAWSR